MNSEKQWKNHENSEKRSGFLNRRIIGIVVIAIIIIGVVFAVWFIYNQKKIQAELIDYNNAVDNYNIVAQAYNDSVSNASVDFIEDMPASYPIKANAKSINDVANINDYKKVDEYEKEILADTEAAIGNYLVVKQIINPSEEWVQEKLGYVDDINGMQAVTLGNDPNGLLGKEGGYTSCIYFSVKDIDAAGVEGSDIVEKGTDAGGAIEVYDTLEHALNRCDYLSQFDNTLLYSGSYAVVGTMVIRTSYQLDNTAQCDLTNQIVESMTTIDTTK